MSDLWPRIVFTQERERIALLASGSGLRHPPSRALTNQISLAKFSSTARRGARCSQRPAFRVPSGWRASCVVRLVGLPFSPPTSMRWK